MHGAGVTATPPDMLQSNQPDFHLTFDTHVEVFSSAGGRSHQLEWSLVSRQDSIYCSPPREVHGRTADLQPEKPSIGPPREKRSRFAYAKTP